MPKVKNTCVSKVKGQKSEIQSINLIENLGVEGDFHAKGGERQVSLLAEESIQKMREKGLTLLPGAFGENVVTEKLNLRSQKSAKSARRAARSIIWPETALCRAKGSLPK